LKLYYVQDLLLNIITSKSELLTNRLCLKEFHQLVNTTLDREKIKLLNAKEIREYIYLVINENNVPINNQYISLVVLFVILCGFFFFINQLILYLTYYGRSLQVNQTV
jgi:hypothetical protein